MKRRQRRTYKYLEEMDQLAEIQVETEPGSENILMSTRDDRIARKIVDEIRRIQTRPWVIMEVCGGSDALHRESTDWITCCLKAWS